MSLDTSDDELLDDELLGISKEYLDLTFKDSNDSKTISNIMATSLTSTNNKIIEALTADRQLEPTIVEHLLGILKENNDEFLRMLKQRNKLEEQRLDIIDSMIKLHPSIMA
jgi:hypothetical protein